MTTDVTDTHFTTEILAEEEIESNKNNGEDKQKLTFLTWIGCIVPILACLATCMAFIGYRLLRSERAIIRISFLSILGLGEACFIAGLTLYADVPGVCAMTALFTHFACLSSFAWLLSYILFLGNEIKGDGHYYALSTSHYTTIGWGVPFLTVLISLIWRYDSFMDEDYCWLNSEDLMELAFVIPVVFLILVSYIIMAYVMHIYYQAVKNPTRKLMLKVTRSGIRSCFVLLPVLGATWLLGTYAVMKRHKWLQVTFSLCNVALGILIFIFMFIWNEEIIQKRKERRGFFPSSAKEKRAKEEEKLKKRRRSLTGVVHPMIPRVATTKDESVCLTQKGRGTDRSTVSHATVGPNASEMTQIVSLDRSAEESCQSVSSEENI